MIVTLTLNKNIYFSIFGVVKDVQDVLRGPAGLLNANTFPRIIGLTNRPLSLADSGLPIDDPRLTLVSGANLLSTAEDVTKHLREKDPMCRLSRISISPWYCSEFSAHIPITPLVESAPRTPQSWSDNIYYSQSDLLSTLSSDKRWRTVDIHPGVIVEFVPNGNIMNAAQQLALYLFLYQRVYGAESRVAFPGTQKSWGNTHTDTS
ncbi:hypothetical protein BDD12DRAFT_910651 [Trichophaea hybrida]|nr:hypothetical protein BDD12DRAFT_910651 [Trichophaea hybrida]